MNSVKIKAGGKLFHIVSETIVEVTVDKVGTKYFYYKGGPITEGSSSKDLIGKAFFLTAEEAQAKLASDTTGNTFLDTLRACDRLRLSHVLGFFSVEEMESIHHRLQGCLASATDIPFKIGDRVALQDPAAYGSAGIRERCRSGRLHPHQQVRADVDFRFVEIVRYMGSRGALLKVIDDSEGYDREFYITSNVVTRVE
jgi:hypothetical protein